jgi:hypothetical protein
MIAARKLRAVAASLLVGALAALVLAVAPPQHSSALAEDPNWDSGLAAPIMDAAVGSDAASVASPMDPNWG